MGSKYSRYSQKGKKKKKHDYKAKEPIWGQLIVSTIPNPGKGQVFLESSLQNYGHCLNSASWSFMIRVAFRVSLLVLFSWKSYSLLFYNINLLKSLPPNKLTVRSQVLKVETNLPPPYFSSIISHSSKHPSSHSYWTSPPFPEYTLLFRNFWKLHLLPLPAKSFSFGVLS